MENLNISINPDKFDKAVHGGLDAAGVPVLVQDGAGDIFVKPNGTVGGKPVAVITFLVKLPDGSTARAQLTTTAALLAMAGGIVKGWSEGGHI
jgi:hypothetical protein